MALGLLGAIVSGAGKLAQGAVNLVSGTTKAQRQEIRAAKKEAKEEKIQDKIAKIKGSSEVSALGIGSQGSGFMDKAVAWLKKNWWIAALALVGIFIVYRNKKKVTRVRRRRSPIIPVRRRTARRKR